MAPLFAAPIWPLLTLFAATVIAVPQSEVCDCEATCAEIVAHQRKEIERLQAEVRTLRGDADRDARRAQMVISRCDRDWQVTSDAEVEAFRLAGCRAVKTLTIGRHPWQFRSYISSLAGLSSLETAERVEIIDNEELVSLAGLDNLRRIEETLMVHRNHKLESLAGLHGLETARDVWITEIHEIHSLTGLENLTRVEGRLIIRSNDQLRSFTGLQGLETVEQVEIRFNNALESLTGLDNLVRLGSLYILSNQPLRSITSLQGLRTVGVVDIQFNNHLQSLAGLENLARVVEKLIVRGNRRLRSVAGLQSLKDAHDIELSDAPLLESLTGLENLTHVGKLTLSNLGGLRSIAALRSLTAAWDGGILISSCSKLRSLEGLGTLHISQLQVRSEPYSAISAPTVQESSMEFLGGPLALGSSVYRLQFDEVAWPRCVTPHERMSLLSVVVDKYASSVPNATWQPECGTDFGTFSCTKGQPCSLLLAGEGSNHSSVFVSARLTGCGACSESHVRGDVEEGGTVDFGRALRDEEAGLYSLCRCAGEIGPVAQLWLRVVKTCSRGRNCTFRIEGEGLERTDRVVLMSSCSNDPSVGLTANWTANNLHILHDPSTWYSASAGQYQVCWRAPCTSAPDGPTCPAPEDSYFDVGRVELLGAYPRNYDPVLDAVSPFTVPNIGLGVADGDQMRLRRDCGEVDEEEAYVLAARSSGMVFDFGRLTGSRVEAGRHHLCWCQERDGAQCNATWHFRADAGVVQIRCPAGQELIDSRRCKSCPAGKQQPEPGLDPCLECPIGQFSRGANEMCAVCPVGEVAVLTGSSACVACLAWQSADAGAASCSPDLVMLVLLAMFHLLVGAFTATLACGFRRQMSVVDVSLVQDKTIVTMFKSHGLTKARGLSFPVKLHGTGNRDLDSPTQPFRARVTDAVRLELLTLAGESITCRLDTSMGTLTVAFPHDLSRQRKIVVGLPVLFTAAAALSGAVVPSGLIAEALFGATAVALTCTAAVVAVRLRPHATPLNLRLSEFKQKLEHRLRRSRQIEKGPNRAIAIGKLQELLEFFHDFIRDRNAYYLDNNILKPLTKARRISYAELAGAGKVEWFVSHYWGTPFQHFCTSLRKHAEMVCGQRDWTTLRYWVCFCSNNQYELREELGGEAGWVESSFYLTLKSGECHGTCMVLDDKALPLTRIWCIFELLQTVKLERSDAAFQGLLLCTSGGVLNTGGGSPEVAVALAEKVAGMDLETAQASSASDASMIRDQVMEEMGSFTALNRFICGQMRAMLVRARERADHHFVAVLAQLDQTIIANTENEETRVTL